MPARVVVVKRARRRSFALLWAAIAWLRSVLAAFVRPGRRREAEPLHDSKPADVPENAAERFGVSSMPVLRFALDGEPLCTGCNVCVEICPSRALELEAASPPGTGGLRRFALRLGACIGCGACAEACPEQALGLVPAPAAVLADGSGRPEPIDLLERPDGQR